MVADLPGRLVVDLEVVGDGHRLAEVDQPDRGLLRVVDKQKRTADQLKKGFIVSSAGISARSETEEAKFISCISGLGMRKSRCLPIIFLPREI